MKKKPVIIQEPTAEQLAKNIMKSLCAKKEELTLEIKVASEKIQFKRDQLASIQAEIDTQKDKFLRDKYSALSEALRAHPEIIDLLAPKHVGDEKTSQGHRDDEGVTDEYCPRCMLQEVAKYHYWQSTLAPRGCQEKVGKG